MGQEILVTTDDLGAPTLRPSHPSKDEPPSSPISPEVIRQDASDYTFVFHHPDHLTSIFRNAETHEQIAKHMRRLRLLILNPIANSSLTDLEENGSTDGPNTSPLVEKWWVASRAIPRGHGIEFVIFDLSFPQEIHRREIVRVLQGLSTTLSIKANGNFGCCVEGCEGERKEWLENSLVGLKKSED